MKKWIVFVIGCSIFTAVLAFAAGSDGGQETSDVVSLEIKIAALEQRVSALEAKQMEHQIPTKVVVPQKWPPMQNLPRGWQQREFNGIPYYITPVENHLNKPSEPDAP